MLALAVDSFLSLFDYLPGRYVCSNEWRLRYSVLMNNSIGSNSAVARALRTYATDTALRHK